MLSSLGEEVEDGENGRDDTPTGALRRLTAAIPKPVVPEAFKTPMTLSRSPFKGVPSTYASKSEASIFSAEKIKEAEMATRIKQMEEMELHLKSKERSLADKEAEIDLKQEKIRAFVKAVIGDAERKAEEREQRLMEMIETVSLSAFLTQDSANR